MHIGMNPIIVRTPDKHAFCAAHAKASGNTLKGWASDCWRSGRQCRVATSPARSRKTRSTA